jgi:hypothetical protein
VSVVCCQVEVPVTRPTERGASLCVSRNLVNEKALAHLGFEQ